MASTFFNNLLATPKGQSTSYPMHCNNPCNLPPTPQLLPTANFGPLTAGLLTSSLRDVLQGLHSRTAPELLFYLLCREPFEVTQYGPRFTGVSAQILGADDKYICQFSEESQNFWGDGHELILGNTSVAKNDLRPPNKELPPQEFDNKMMEGFQVTPLWHQGQIKWRQLVGNIVRVLFMVGAMLGLHRSLQLAGLQLFLFLNLTDKYAWRVDYQQACANTY
ncbi:hypothetical protein Ahy_B10g104912 [Arachis hypogaea]|uniref:Uncharacterized protein n=1 Tax=Arachis hypogaea TaxID=3818 RepID=A0A444X6T3_ARAHY|nr:hypothetical protein Ahy_B10g104912 [Arachis hypogaea]